MGPQDIGVRDPRTGLFRSWVRELDWAWTPEETSSVAAVGVAAAVARVCVCVCVQNQILRFSTHVDDLGTIFAAF